MTHVDWKRRRCFVEPTDIAGRARWTSEGGGLSFEITRGMRDVVLGTDPAGVTLSKRARATLDDLRAHHAGHVDPDALVIRQRPDGDLHWWTWAGSAANRTLHASLDIVDPKQRLGDQVLRLRQGTSLHEASDAISRAHAEELIEPAVDRRALRGLKFSAALALAEESRSRDRVRARGGPAARYPRAAREAQPPA